MRMIMGIGSWHMTKLLCHISGGLKRVQGHFTYDHIHEKFAVYCLVDQKIRCCPGTGPAMDHN